MTTPEDHMSDNKSRKVFNGTAETILETVKVVAPLAAPVISEVVRHKLQERREAKSGPSQSETT